MRVLRVWTEIEVIPGVKVTIPLGAVGDSITRTLQASLDEIPLENPPTSGMFRTEESNMLPTEAEAVGESLDQTIGAWQEHLAARGRSSRYIAQAVQIVHRASQARGWIDLRFVTSREIDAYVTALKASGATRNKHLGYFSSFLGFCWRTERIKENPARKVCRATEFKEGGNRAFSSDEAAAVIAAARMDAESAHPRFRAVDRWKLYLLAWHTGLRRMELRTLQVREVRLSDSPPRIVLRPRTAKSKKEQTIPLHPELVPILRECCADKHPTDRVFIYLHDRVVPEDIIAAGVRRIIDGHTTGLHSFRKGLATQLALKNVDEATAQKIMRHTDPRLTRNLYTDARLLPIAEAIGRVQVVTGSGAREDSFRNKLDKDTGNADTHGAEARSIVTNTLPPNHELEVPGRAAMGWSYSSQSTPQHPNASDPALRAPGADAAPNLNRAAGEKCRRQGSKVFADRMVRNPLPNLLPSTVSAPTRASGLWLDNSSHNEGNPRCGGTTDDTSVEGMPSASFSPSPLGTGPSHGGSVPLPCAPQDEAMHATASTTSVLRGGGLPPFEPAAEEPRQAPLTGGQRGESAAAGVFTTPLPADPGQPRSCPGLLDELTVARSLIDRAAESKGRQMNLYRRAAALVLLAGALGMSNSPGYDCYAVFCKDTPTVAACVVCCFAYCSVPGNPTVESDCQKACGGWVPGSYSANGLVLESALRSMGLEHADAARRNEDVLFIGAVSTVNEGAAGIAAESLFVRLHNEQGDTR